MTISLLGILLIVLMIGVFAYIGIAGLTSKVSSNVDSGSAYDQLASLNQEYNQLSNQLNGVKSKADGSQNGKIQSDYTNADLALVKANSAIGDVESALSTNAPASEVNSRISIAANQLKQAQTSINIVTGEV